MRVLITAFFRAPLGGLQDNVRATAKALRAADMDVVVACPPGPFIEALCASGIATEALDFDHIEGSVSAVKARAPFDLVHAHPGSIRNVARPVANASGAPLIVTVHGRWSDRVETHVDELALVIAVSPAVRDMLVSKAPIQAHRIVVVANGIDIETFTTGTDAVDVDDTLRVAVVSRFDQDKRMLIDFILEIIKLQMERRSAVLRWSFAGAGTCLHEIRAATESLSSTCGIETAEFLGWLDTNQLVTLYRRADAALVPGRCALEAMACGLPTVALGSAGCVGLMEGRQLLAGAHCNFGGYGLADPVSAASVLESLLALAGDATQRRKIGMAGAEFVRANFAQAAQDDKLLALYAATMAKA